MGKSQDLYNKAKTLIPGGTQLLSKRPEMFLPDHWPAYWSRAEGCTVWDLDGNKYRDMITMGIGACILGYADPDVNRAVKEVIDSGSMTSLNPPQEVELAELFLELHPWADMARFGRSGGEAMTQAVRIGRAASGKDTVLFCGYHGWHDWYIAANLAEEDVLDGHLLPGLEPKGVPRALLGSAIPFEYNDIEGFNKAAEKHKDTAGVIVLEAIRNDKPDQEFINRIKEVAEERGMVFIVDEITSGFRLNPGGAHLLYDIEPDIAVFAKGISNGYPMAAVIGKKKVMEACQESFISSTYWTEAIGPTAAIATIRKMLKHSVQDRLIEIGKTVQEGWQKAAENNGLSIHVSGIYPLGHFGFNHEQPLVLKTLYTQFMLEKGFLATNALYASFAHSDKDLEDYLSATDEVFKQIAALVEKGSPEKALKGPVCHAGFRRLN